jgi:hypothetical protein
MLSTNREEWFFNIIGVKVFKKKKKKKKGKSRRSRRRRRRK